VLDIGRIGVAAMGVGLAQGALDEALSYARGRQAFGRSIAGFQTIQAKLADLATEIEAARLERHHEDGGRPRERAGHALFRDGALVDGGERVR